MYIFSQLLTAFLGSLGFAGMFNVKKEDLFSVSFGGFLSWGIYLGLEPWIPSDALRFLIASFCITIYAEIMAYRHRTPTTLFIVPGTIPLIPGGSLYKTMRFAVEGDSGSCLSQAIYTISLAAAIAGGIILAMIFWTILKKSLLQSRKTARSFL